MTSLVAHQLGQHLPGLVDSNAGEMQWLTPGGRHAQFFFDQSILAVIWTHNNTSFPREYNGTDLSKAARAVRKQAYDLAFSNAFEPLVLLRGQKYAATQVTPADLHNGIIIRLSAHQLNIACLELKLSSNYPAQIRPLSGAFYPQPQLTQDIISDMWGSEEQMDQWYNEGVFKFTMDPDSTLQVD